MSALLLPPGRRLCRESRVTGTGGGGRGGWGWGRLAGEAQEDTAGEGVVSRSGAGESRRHIEEML